MSENDLKRKRSDKAYRVALILDIFSAPPLPVKRAGLTLRVGNDQGDDIPADACLEDVERYLLPRLIPFGMKTSPYGLNGPTIDIYDISTLGVLRSDPDASPPLSLPPVAPITVLLSDSIAALDQTKYFHLYARGTLPPLPSALPPAPAPSTWMNFIQTSPVALEEPSTVAKNPSSVQNAAKDRVWNDRPQAEQGIAPCALLYSPFGTFQDIFEGRSAVGEFLDEASLQRSVLEFAAHGRAFYSSEHERRAVMLSDLNNIFRSHENAANVPLMVESTIGSFPRVATDGHRDVMLDAASIVAEFKNELLGINAEAELEAIAYVTQSHAKSTSLHPERYAASRMPVLVLTIQGNSPARIVLSLDVPPGPFVRFYAVILLQRPRVVELTPMLGLRHDGAEPMALTRLFNAFRAACVLQAHIHTDATALLAEDRVSLRPLLDPRFPAVTRVRKFPAGPQDEHLEFELIARLHPSPNRLLFTATTGTETVLVKFSKTYSVDLHSFCQEAGHAPVLLGYDCVPGGWHVIVMESLDGESLHMPSMDHAMRQTVYAQMQQLLDGMHTRGFVHGDLRCANIVAQRGWERTDPEGTLLKVVDFDWGGKQGEVRFPYAVLSNEHRGRELKTAADLVITCKDDRRILRNTLGL
ncbi:hypothetical protein B0H17DRAFT_385197 [Mycena rosella]|uniref:Protein kinase domain-containing protein n=1 Tax=Mycena rosella TaxID=1033263 RepID=A0AAD7CNC7_MYCRO|nr:hypothetical protein B0H17DRAFT_385197 [Mycena rosella]